jgi:hypothetical protein
MSFSTLTDGKSTALSFETAFEALVEAMTSISKEKATKTPLKSVCFETENQ